VAAWLCSCTAEAAICSTSAAFCCVMLSICDTASLTCEMPISCSCAPVLISLITWVTLRTVSSAPSMVFWASSVSLLPASTVSVDSLMSCLISRAADEVRWDSARTSEATTAKPRPCSPARAASTAAFRARMLVWKAMPSMTPMISLMRRDDSLITCMVRVTSFMASLPRCVTALALLARSAACWADAALLRTVLVICSMDDAVSSRLAACDSVRADRSWLPAAISRVASRMWSTSLRASRTMERRFTLSCARARPMRASSSSPAVSMRSVRSPAAMRLAVASRRSSGRSASHRAAVLPTAAPSAAQVAAVSRAVAPRPPLATLAARADRPPTKPVARPVRPATPRLSARLRRAAGVSSLSRPPSSRCTRRPAEASSRMSLYKASEASTCARVGSVRTDM
jgi:hypothetical protein